MYKNCNIFICGFPQNNIIATRHAKYVLSVDNNIEFVTILFKYFLEPNTKVNNIEDYDSAFEDESVTGEEKESCSRTTPNNHKSIRKWRQHSHPGGIKNNSSNIKNGHKLINPPTPPNASKPDMLRPISCIIIKAVITTTNIFKILTTIS